jgi:hypothetical protein
MNIFTFKNIIFDLCNNYMRDYPNYKFVELEYFFYNRYCTIQNDEQVYMHAIEEQVKQEMNE